MPWFKPSDRLDQTFEITMIIKLFIGIFEIVTGLAILFVSPTSVDRLASTHKGIYGFIINYSLSAVHGLRSLGIWFVAFYLLSHGLAKFILGVAVMRNKLWVYPVMMCYLVGFIIYQLYRMTFAPSVALGLLTVFDVFITWLAYRKYHNERRLYDRFDPT
jgi:uncharacterized membrane protein